MNEPGLKKLAICTPAYDGRAHINYFRGICDIRDKLAARGMAVAWIDASHSANLPRLRNALTAKALDWGADAILWVDSDIAGNANDALRLIESGKDIIGAAPQKRPRSLNEKPEVAFSLLPENQVKMEDGLIEVGGVATAFCLMRRAVFERLRDTNIAKPLGNREGAQGPWFRNFFWYELVEKDGLYLDDGEDLYFCRKAREAGFKCFIEPNIRPVHHEGNIQLTANFWDLHGASFQMAAA